MSTTLAAATWFFPPRLSRTAALRLFCFPYAGGGASIFQPWRSSLGESVEVCPVLLPGREGRLMEPPLREMGQLVRAVAEGLAPYLDAPFAFFGHSMGALVAFELARHLRRTERPLPERLFVSGCGAPHLGETRRPIFGLPEPELVEELRRLNGTPPAVLEHEELRRLFLPVIRADFEVCQTYVYADEPPLGCPITAFGGLRDEESPRLRVSEWRRETASSFALWMLPGSHFFVHTSSEQLLRILSRELRDMTAGR